MNIHSVSARLSTGVAATQLGLTSRMGSEVQMGQKVQRFIRFCVLSGGKLIAPEPLREREGLH
jgi:hypothetical protein